MSASPANCVPTGIQRFRLVGRAAYLNGVLAVLAPLIRSLEVSLPPTSAQSARGGRVSKGDVAWLAADPVVPGSRLAAMVLAGNRKAPPSVWAGLVENQRVDTIDFSAGT